jgi:glycerol-3-phosphate dehydrogenase
MGDRTCVGTTDTRVPSPAAQVTDEDRVFVLDNINKRLKLARPLTPADVIAERCGVRPLVVAGDAAGQNRDWFQLSRKHVLDVDDGRRHVSIFGGKLTDCVNIGEEITQTVRRLGIAVPAPRAPWYGEPGEDVRGRYAARAQSLGLGSLDDPALGHESTAARLWRRYGDDAAVLLDDIERDPTLRQPAFADAPDLRCEVAYAGRKEMVTTLDDYLRRRTQLLQTRGRPALVAHPALRDVARLLFGDDADARIAEFVGDAAPLAATATVTRTPTDPIRS